MKTMLITGASSGIGEATARLARQNNYQLVLAARSMDKLSSLVDDLGGKEFAIAKECDVQNFDSQQELMQSAIDAFGSLDVVFANAGLGASEPGVEHGDIENWHEMIMTNFYGAALTAKAAIPHMKKVKGQLILTGSVAGRRTLKGSIYGATKWAVTGLGYNLREELNGTGCRVTLIEPGMVNTPFFDDPKENVLEPEDIARTVMFAVSQPDNVDLHEIQVLPTAPMEK